jgi:predicted neutral ceramidase superfamily lipid hydrolase
MIEGRDLRWDIRIDWPDQDVFPIWAGSVEFPDHSPMKIPKWTSSFIPASAVMWAAFFLLAVAAYFLAPDDFAYTSIICLSGFVVGIPIGVMASPYKDEEYLFKTLAGFVASFVSGIIAAKFSEMKLDAALLGNPLFTGRALLFVSFLIIGVMQTFVLRRYFDKTRLHGSYSE